MTTALICLHLVRRIHNHKKSSSQKLLMINWLSDFRRNRPSKNVVHIDEHSSARRHQVSLALLKATTDLINVEDEMAMLQCLCECIAACSPRIRLTWAWIGSTDSEVIRPCVAAGSAKAYAHNFEIHRNWLTARGPAFQALMNGEPDLYSMTWLSRLLFKPWNSQEGQSFEVAAALPIKMPDPSRRGLIVMYADEPDYFEKLEIEPFMACLRLCETALKQMDKNKLLRIQAMTDPLTGLLNRRAMSEQMVQAISMARRQGGTFSVIMCDLDHFKRVNDTWGHEIGDQIIVQLTQLVRQSLRQEDQFARLGGEEFLCLLPQTDQDSAYAVAEKLRLMIALTPLNINGQHIFMTASFGVAGYRNLPGEPDDIARQMLARADAALYLSKDNGRNRISA